MKNQNLEELRSEIDKIDEKILELLTNRFIFSKKIGNLKKSINKSHLDLDRQQKLVNDRIKSGLKKNLPEELIRKIWNLIHSHSVKIQSE